MPSCTLTCRSIPRPRLAPGPSFARAARAAAMAACVAGAVFIAGAASAAVTSELPLRLGGSAMPSTRELLAQWMFGLGLGCIGWSLQRIARQRGPR